MRFYVYELFDPRTDITFYVGKGQRNRINAHEVEAFNGRVSRKCDTIRAIQAAGFQIGKRKIAHFDDEVKAYEFEKERIESFEFGVLTNVAHGGVGAMSGVLPPKPTKNVDYATVKACSIYLSHEDRLGGTNWEIPTGPGRSVIMDFRVTIDWFLQDVYKIARKRGYEFVNEISKKYGVTFEDGGQATA